MVALEDREVCYSAWGLEDPRSKSSMFIDGHGPHPVWAVGSETFFFFYTLRTVGPEWNPSCFCAVVCKVVLPGPSRPFDNGRAATATTWVLLRNHLVR